MMNAGVADDAEPPSGGKAGGLNGQFSKYSYESLGTSTLLGDDQELNTPEPTSPRANPMAFTIDLGPAKPVDRSRLEELAKKSQARHQRVHSMFASLTKPSPVEQKAPMSAKLPRKAQGYNSEGYFSSDQEDGLGSVKRQSPLAQSLDRTHISSTTVCLKSPEAFVQKRLSKSPIVDSIMSRSDILPSRQSLNLPLKNTNSPYMRDVHRTPSYGMLSSSYQPRGAMADIIDQSPDALLLTDISSPELDILTPDNPPTPNHSSPRRRAMSEAPDLLLTKCPPMKEPLYIDDDVERESNNSSTGTYTIEADYTEEQKARMSIDRTLASSAPANNCRGASSERDPELVYDYLEPKTLRNNLMTPENKYTPKVKERNILEIACCYESPSDNDLAAQTSKQIKSTRSYLEKIKNRVKTITDRTFSRSPPKFPAENQDVGSFTSVTTSGVLSSKMAPRRESLRRYSLTKSEMDRSDYIHRLSRESSVPVSLPSKKLEEKFESTPLRMAHRLREEQAAKSEQHVGQLSYLSLNRCKGDKNWIQDWADSVKKYNNDSQGEGDMHYIDDRPPQSPRRENVKGPSSRGSSGGTPSKIPSPVGTLLQRRTPDLIPSTQDTESYLQRTQHAISSLQAKLQTKPSALTSSYHEPSKLPVSQLSRSNSLNYRLRKTDDPKDTNSPGNCVIAGEQASPLSPNADRSILIKSYNVDAILSPHRRHVRHKSFDGRAVDLNASAVSLKAVLRNNAAAIGIDPTRCHGDAIKRSTSFTTVRGSRAERRADSDNADGCSDNSEGRVDSPDLKSLVPTNSPRCANTPELQRRFGGVRHSVRVTSKERGLNTLGAKDRGSRVSEPRQLERPSSHQSRISEPTKQAVLSRLTKSRSSTRELQPKGLDKALSKKPAQHRSSSALATKEIEFSNWKKRSSYDPMKAAQEGRKRQMSKRKESNKDDMSSPSHSSPVHRSQSFHTTNMADLAIDYSSEEDTLPIDNAMITSTHSDIPDMRRTEYRDIRRQPLNKEVVLAKEYVPSFQINQKLRNADKRKTFILDDVTPTRENVDFLRHPTRDNSDSLRRPTRDNESLRDATRDKRRTFILDSDNSTTNESSPRNSSIFSHDKGTSDTEESGTESSAVVLRRTGGAKQRPTSGDYSMSSSTTSTNKKQVQPRYLDISKYKNETSPKNFLRRDPSKTYVGVLGEKQAVSRGSAQQYELEQKKQELEKWKRRASYDPRKAAAQAKAKPRPTNNVLRSQSFHGPLPPPPQIVEYDGSSDNDF